MARCALERRWREFQAEHPKVETTLVRLALDLRRKGYKCYGLPAIWEVLRYNMALDVPGADYKFPNGYKAYYARLIMLKYPVLDGFFRTRGMFRNGEPDLSDLVD